MIEITEAQSKATLIRRLRRNGVLNKVVRIVTLQRPTRTELGKYKITLK